MSSSTLPPKVYQRKGSRVELWFHQASRLQVAKSAVEELQRQESSGRKIWLDAKKTRKELKPARVVARAFEVLQELEEGRPDKVSLTLLMKGKVVKHPHGRVGYTWRGDWC